MSKKIAMIGAGGVFRGHRTIRVLVDIARDMEEAAKPGAIMLQYANPMACNCVALGKASKIGFVGLCHEVPTFADDPALAIGKRFGRLIEQKVD